MEEIIKNNNELQNDNTITKALDEAMGVTSPDIMDESATTEYTADGSELTDDDVVIQYACGVSLTMSYSDMDWDGIWKNAVPDMLSNMAVLKQMYHDILITPNDDARNKQAEEAISLVREFFNSVGVPEIDYNLRENIPIVEKALCTITDCIILLYELTHTAQVYVLMSQTDGMTIDKMIQKMSEEMQNFHFGGDNN